MVTYLWFCAVGCSSYFELLKDRNSKPRERGVESLLNAARLDWHNVLNAHVGSVCSDSGEYFWSTRSAGKGFPPFL